MSEKNPPNWSDIIICEDIRTEVGNKASLMGVFAGDDIVLTSRAPELPPMPNLSFFCRFAGASGIFRPKFELVGPDASVLASGEMAESKAIESDRMILVVQIHQIKLKRGEHTFRVNMDDSRYEKRFSVV